MRGGDAEAQLWRIAPEVVRLHAAEKLVLRRDRKADETHARLLTQPAGMKIVRSLSDVSEGFRHLVTGDVPIECAKVIRKIPRLKWHEPQTLRPQLRRVQNPFVQGSGSSSAKNACRPSASTT